MVRAFSYVGKPEIMDWQSGQPLGRDYKGRCMVYGFEDSPLGHLFETWVDAAGGERNWKAVGEVVLVG